MSFNSTAVIETIVNAVPKNIYFLPPKTYPGTSNVGTAAPYQVNWDPPLSKFDDTSTTLPRYQEYASLFTLTFPATLRQPLYTAAQVFAERSRQQWWDFYRYPVVYSAYGASAPSTLAQLEDPIPAISVPDSEISAMAQQKAVDGDITSYPIIWGATRTTTFETSVTAEPGDVVFLRFPTLTGPVPTEYTTLPAPTDPAAKDFPNGLPVLVLTQVNGAPSTIHGGGG
ncbi:MAG: hypothetical protein M1832_006021 [Thelocarpon impressellum]|nr:MAG: hypothetical protein M1832_006021 [Thelocarpon impressellum]